MIAFQTEHLLLRTFEHADLDALARLCADATVCRFVGDGQPLDRSETALWIERSRANVARHGFGTGAVIERSSGRLAGWAGVARPDTGGEEIVYGLDRPYWGRGLGTELLGGLLAWLRELGQIEARATVHPDNDASVAMLRRCGFVRLDEAYEGDPLSHLYVLALQIHASPS